MCLGKYPIKITAVEILGKWVLQWNYFVWLPWGGQTWKRSKIKETKGIKKKSEKNQALEERGKGERGEQRADFSGRSDREDGEG